MFQGCRCTIHGHQVLADRSDDRPAGVVESPNHDEDHLHFGGQGALPELRFVELGINYHMRLEGSSRRLEDQRPSFAEIAALVPASRLRWLVG